MEIIKSSGIYFIAFSYVTQLLASRWIDNSKLLATNRINKLAIDEQLGLVWKQNKSTIFIRLFVCFQVRPDK